ncbi:MAG: tyrosine-protein phosphatase [Erysipelotrichaceae bacterium]|nr:tyrosine-protein phosphatase [Erysipelotrichaceae bacterium]MDY6034209.1 tyrosine-protein phosphatase [Bulleidia sp.]
MREITNFRDLGGVKTQDGRVVKTGLLYRSCYLGWMNEDELEHLKQIGIHTVFDLRTSYEAYESPDPIMDGIKLYRVSGMRDRNGEGVDFSPYGIHKMIIDDQSSPTVLHEHMHQLYRDMMFRNESFMFLLELLKDMDNFPLLFHCATGKDRTGALAILIYQLLGVSIEDMMHDYLQSNVAYHDRIQQALEKHHDEIRLNPSLKQRIVMEAGVDEAMGKEMIDGILKQYSSYDEFFLKEYGIDTNRKEEIRNQLLTKV